MESGNEHKPLHPGSPSIGSAEPSSPVSSLRVMPSAQLAQPFLPSTEPRPSPSWTPEPVPLLSPVAWFLWRSPLPILWGWAALVILSSCFPKWPWGWQIASSPPEPDFTWVKWGFAVLFGWLGRWAQPVKKVLSACGPRSKAIWLTASTWRSRISYHQGPEYLTGGWGASRIGVRIWLGFCEGFP